MRILIITNSIPYPTTSGDRVRTYSLIRRIAREHQVWLAALLDRPEEVESIPHMQEFCHRVEAANRQRSHPLAHLPGLLRYAVARKPLEFKFQHSEDLVHRIRCLVSSADFDVVHIEPSEMALYLEALQPDAHYKRILVFHNVASDQYARIFRVDRRPVGRMRALLHSQEMRRWEPRYAERFDRCVTVSEADRRLLLTANPRLQVHVIPNGVDTKVYQPLPQKGASPTLLFVGTMSYAACSDAVLYFCREILPHIRRMIGDVEMWIVGTDPPPDVRELDGDGVHVTGQVEDVVPYYTSSSVCVAPLRAGGGTRLKILEAMALGRPVVSSSVGCEGLDVVNGEHLLIADRPDHFAQEMVRILTDRGLHERITANARQLVVTRYDWDVIAKQLMQVYAEMVE